MKDIEHLRESSILESRLCVRGIVDARGQHEICGLLDVYLC